MLLKPLEGNKIYCLLQFFWENSTTPNGEHNGVGLPLATDSSIARENIAQGETYKMVCFLKVLRGFCESVRTEYSPLIPHHVL
jgi:hypothetical protein